MVKVRSLGWFLFHLERGFLGWVGGEVFLEFYFGKKNLEKKFEQKIFEKKNFSKKINPSV